MRYTRLISTPGNWTDGTNNWTDSDGNVWTYTIVTNVPPILLTIPASSFRLTVPARVRYSENFSVSVLTTGNWTDGTNNWTDNNGNIWTYQTRVTQNAKPIILTIPPADAELVVKD